LTLSEEDRQGRNCFVAWCEAAGCRVTVDRLGNIFALRPGKAPDLPPIAAGSHLDTQPHGGRFDGVFGVLAALEVLRTLEDHGFRTEAPVAAVVWTNEEGARFAPSMMGSAVFAGILDLADALTTTDRGGVSVSDALEAIGYSGSAPCGGRVLGTFFEAHIEQGPLLESEGKTIGIVTGAQGMTWLEVTVTGQDAHAGTTPVDLRRDALLGAARMVDAVHGIAVHHGPEARATVGVINALPGSPNTVPGAARFSVDMRHPASATLERMVEDLRARCQRIGGKLDLETRVEQVEYTAPVSFDAGCIESIRSASDLLGYESMEIGSGAGHDACHIARVAPTGMIFVPCAAGISHNEEESADPADLEAGCNVLLHAVLERAL
jgi:N-carbamoyl-L-amino-acid hydrolase